MKNILIISSVAIMLLLSGCGQNTPQVRPIIKDNTSKTDGGAQGTLDQNVIIENSGIDASASAINSQLQSVYFDFDRFRIRSNMQDRVDSDVSLLNTSANRVKVAGSCDEWGSDEYNYALGLKRASSLKKALISGGVSRERVSIISFGENKPVCSSATKACWSKNRRADVRVLP